MEGSNDNEIRRLHRPGVIKLPVLRRGLPFAGDNIIVVGGSRGVGRGIVESAARNGGRVLAVARQLEPLRQLAQQVPGIEVFSLDATVNEAPSRVFEVMVPNVLVLCAGAYPPIAPLHTQSWEEFAVNWQTDVKIAFDFCKAALTRPLAAGASVVLISSAVAIGGSPITGGYAGAKRTQMFIANYSQKESDRLGLGLRFMTLAPRIIPDTDLGNYAVAGYSRYLGISAANFVKSMVSPPTICDIASAVTQLASNPDKFKGQTVLMSGNRLETMSSSTIIEDRRCQSDSDDAG